MWNGSRLKPLQASPVFPDSRSARPLVADTVARGSLDPTAWQTTGLNNGKDVDLFPTPVTAQMIDRGQQRFNIYCSPCHGLTGDADGMVVRRGFPKPPSYHAAWLRKKPVGHYVDVMTNGYGVMYSYAERVAPPDRWAIAAYIRVLQRSRDATLNDAPPNVRDRLRGAAK